jgi:hypothetical protein
VHPFNPNFFTTIIPIKSTLPFKLISIRRYIWNRGCMLHQVLHPRFQLPLTKILIFLPVPCLHPHLHDHKAWCELKYFSLIINGPFSLSLVPSKLTRQSFRRTTKLFTFAISSNFVITRRRHPPCRPTGGARAPTPSAPRAPAP